MNEQLVSTIAPRFGLPVELVNAIIQVESEGDPSALRYEPAFYDRYVRGKGHQVFRPCSRETEEKARAFSWGLMQVMGQVAREEGFTGPYLAELIEPATGIEYGCRHLARHARSFPAPTYGWDAVCAAYNGGKGAVRGPNGFNNPAYPAKVLKALGGRWPERRT